MRMGLIVVGIAAILALAFLYIASVPGWLISIPSTHDPQFVGEWKATWAWTGSGRQHQMMFLKDGTGNVEGYPFRWGTDNGTLYVKRRSAGEGWNCGSAAYEIAPGAKSVRLKGKPTVTIPTEMARL